MNKEFTLKMVIQAIDQVTAPARKMGQAFGDMVRRANLQRLVAALQRVRERISAVAAAAGAAGKRLRDMGGAAIGKITAPLGILGGFALKAAADMETLEVAFQSMLGGADAAKTMVKDLADFSARTPFQLEGIGSAAKQLLSFGVAQGDVMNSLKFLGDIAAGANVPLENMASIFGKAKAKGKAMTEELLQLSDQGIPIIDVLAKKLGRSKSEIFELASAGRISFKTFSSALQSMSAEGGIFANQMEKQSGTLAGLFSTVLDNVKNALAVVGAQMVETFDIKNNMTALIDFIGRLTEGFKAFAQEHPQLTKLIFIFAAGLAVLGPFLVALGVMVSALGMVATGFSILLGPVGLVLAAIAAVAAAAFLIYENWSGIVAFFQGVWDSVAAAFDRGFVQGVMKALEMFNPVVWIAKGVNELIAYLTGVDLYQVGSEWVGGLADGMVQRWAALTDWLGNAASSLIDMLPNKLKDWLGLGGKVGGGLPTQPTAGGSGLVAQPVASALGPQQNNVGGAIKVQFDNAPANMRVRDVKSSTPGFAIDVDAGYAMAGP